MDDRITITIDKPKTDKPKPRDPRESRERLEARFRKYNGWSPEKAHKEATNVARRCTARERDK